MKPGLVLACFIFISLIALSQSSTIDLTFTAVNNTTCIQMDSIKVINRNQGGDTVLYWPDTVLSLYFTDIPKHEQQASGLKIFQNYPNPVTDLTTISIYVPEKDEVIITVMDLLGRLIHKTERALDRGNHSFRFSPGMSNLYLFQAQWRGSSSSIKILHAPTSFNSMSSLEYLGSESITPQIKLMEEIQDFTFALGDQLLYIAYIDTLESGCLDNPEESQTYTFQFATNIPCPGTPVITYEGKTYNTIQIFSQCWLKENLDVGMMIPGTMEQSANGTIEKYCYNDESDSCAKYGGLYQWDEMMQYTTQIQAQGICPYGWHIPDDEDLKVLEGAVDSEFGIGDSTWDGGWYRGFDAGGNIKSVEGWIGENGSDRYGFTGLPAGYRDYTGSFTSVGYYGQWWTSKIETSVWAWHRYLNYLNSYIERTYHDDVAGFSVRCLRDGNYITPIELTFTAVNNTSHIQLERIKVMNRTQCEEVIMFWPDTTLVIPNELDYNIGDTLLFIGYMDNLESGILDSPDENKLYTFQFATNIPCPGIPIVDYEGQVYNTVQIFSQCWLKEDLNVGTMIQDIEEMQNNGIFEKYCIYNVEDSCTKYGGLYQWNEMMQYLTQEGAQGICPIGWHIPSDEDFKVLEGAVDSQYSIGNQEWDIYDEMRGYNAGTNMKTNSGWYEDGNGIDLYGFSGVPAGFRGDSGGFYHSNRYADWWTSTRSPGQEMWVVHLSHDWTGIGQFDYSNYWGFRVRCIKNE